MDENLLNRYYEIIYIDEGQVREQGSFKELMKKKEYVYRAANVVEEIVIE